MENNPQNLFSCVVAACISLISAATGALTETAETLRTTTEQLSHGITLSDLIDQCFRDTAYAVAIISGIVSIRASKGKGTWIFNKKKNVNRHSKDAAR